MPAVVAKSPEKPESEKNFQGSQVGGSSDEILAQIVQKLEQHDGRLKSLKDPFEKLQQSINNVDGRLVEVETGLAQFERGQGPTVSETLYAGIQAKDVFIAVLVGVVQGMVREYPQVMNGKPALRAAHIANAIEVATECVTIAAQRLPKMLAKV